MSKLIIAGPCAAESREQLIDTCMALAATGRVGMLRAGLWKPRTHPGSFEGAGTRGLSWLMEAREATGLPVAVEVATAEHVHSALEHGINALWIGARTTVNPFAVQEIADAVAAGGRHSEPVPTGTGVEPTTRREQSRTKFELCRGAKEEGERLFVRQPASEASPSVKILIKNPVNPDIELWSGAVERFQLAGVRNITLIHRGFSCWGHGVYRNTPLWHLALAMRARHPELPMICDPSHIGGAREYVGEIAQMAADLNFDGLMIESHIDPTCALSDAAQQLTPAELDALLQGLRWRASSAGDAAFVEQLERFRSEIDLLDDDIFELLSRRMAISERIGRQKRASGVPILQDARWRDVVARAVSRAEALGLSPDFVRTILDAIHSESIGHQLGIRS